MGFVVCHYCSFCLTNKDSLEEVRKESGRKPSGSTFGICLRHAPSPILMASRRVPQKMEDPRDEDIDYGVDEYACDIIQPNASFGCGEGEEGEPQIEVR